MIRELRSAHRRIWLALAILLPALVVLALMRRHAPPTAPLPPEVTVHTGGR